MIFSCGRDTVRTLLSMLLTSIILACPLLCGLAEAGHVAHRGHSAEGPSDNHGPAHCPEDTDNCICRGAVQSADIRVPCIDSISSPLPLHGLFGILDHAPAHSLAHLTSEGTATGLAGWGDAVTVRALLQNFRC